MSEYGGGEGEMNAPERIFIDPHADEREPIRWYRGATQHSLVVSGVEYIRSDLPASALSALREENERLKKEKEDAVFTVRCLEDALLSYDEAEEKLKVEIEKLKEKKSHIEEDAERIAILLLQADTMTNSQIVESRLIAKNYLPPPPSEERKGKEK